MARDYLAEARKRISQAARGNGAKLDLMDLNLGTVPPEVWDLTHLTSLDLDGNQLTSLPTEIAKLTKLVHLDHRNNQLTSLPTEIAKLTKLVLLDLRNNQLTSVPTEIAKLTQLESLILSNNQLTSMPTEIAKLTQLEYLDLSNNQLTSMPTEIAKLTQLDNLDLSNNQLTSMPTEIAKLTKLVHLDLRNNQLTSMPTEIAKLTELQYLRLNGNPWPEAFAKVAEVPIDELRAYLRWLGEGVPSYEAKVLLVGEGNVGKTCLLDALRHEPFVEHRDSTHGIEIERVVNVTRVEADKQLVLNVWDFGGQQVYRVTHQFFFSPGALYLLVWKPREGQEENAVKGWLERIRLRVGDAARVLIVATHRNDRYPELDFPALKAEFGDLLIDQPAEVDCSDGRGIDDLRQRVAELATELEDCGTTWPQAWHNAITEIRERTESHIPYGEFKRVCGGHGLDATAARALIGMMHRVGHLVHYNVERLRNFVVLDPEWVTKSIGYVLEDEPTRNGEGVLNHDRLPEIWRERDDTKEQYNPEDYPFFLRLMEKYEVSYRLDEHTSLVPQLVPYQRPDLPWETSTPTQELQMSLTCRMKGEPPGLIAWLTARNYRWVKRGMTWRTGVFLQHEDGNQALIDLVEPRRLTVTVRGPWPAQFMGLVRDSLERLLREEWRGLDYNLLIPCPGLDSEGGVCPDGGSFKLETLHRVFKKEKSARCQGCDEDFPPAKLLVGYVPPSRPPVDLMTEMIARFENLEELTESEFARLRAQGAQQTRWVLRTMISEAKDGPRMFTLEPAEKEGWDRLKIGTDCYKLTLWCEHPGHEHSCDEKTRYDIKQPKDWLMKVGPTVAFMAKCIRMAAPVAAAAAGLPIVGIPADLKPKLEFMDKLSEALLPGGERPSKIRIKDDDLGWSREEGAGLRAFHVLLKQADKEGTSAWAGLRRVTTPSTDILWVCPKHYKIYDRGLPIVP